MSHYRIEGRGKVKAEAVTPPRTKVEVIVRDEKVEGLISVFRNKLGDNIGGKLFVTNVEKAMDLSTGNSDENAI